MGSLSADGVSGQGAGLNIRALQLLRRIVTFGSLAEAAMQSNLTVSTASRLIAQLEAELGLTLFSRARRRLELTEEGARFYAQIANTLVALDEIPKISRDIRQRTRNLLSVVTAAPLANGLAVPGLARMRAEGLDFECTVNVATRFDIESKVAARGFTMGLISLPMENAIIELGIVPFLEARLGVLMPEDHPLAARAVIEPADLTDATFVSLAPGQRWRDRLDLLMQGVGQPVTTAIETGSTLVTVEMVRAGLGLTLIDRVCWRPGGDGLVLRPVAGEHWITYAGLHPPGPRSPLSEAFLDAICTDYEALIATDPRAGQMLRLI